MNAQETVKKIQEYISKGETEQALAALVTITESTDSPLHEDVVLLSGQYQKWKKDSLLGIEQSSHELRRIEMGILELLKDEQIPAEVDNSLIEEIEKELEASQHNISHLQKTYRAGNKNTVPILVGLIGLLAIAATTWFILSRNGQNTPPQEQISTQVQPPSNSNHAPGIHFTRFLIPAGTELIKEKRYPSADNRFYLIFQEDGNLCVYTSADKNFKWGSFQESDIFASSAHFQSDGELVLQDTAKRTWSTNTVLPSASLGVTDHGVLVILDQHGEIAWEGEK
ncbi:MAG: hypothetical protein R3B47_18790 [Bacteroidia bacterium]